MSQSFSVSHTWVISSLSHFDMHTLTSRNNNKNESAFVFSQLAEME